MSKTENSGFAYPRAFVPAWKKLELEAKHYAVNLTPTCFVVPYNQPEIIKKINAFNLGAPIYSLADDASVESIKNACKMHDNPQIVFVSESGANSIDNHVYVLFLQLMKAFSSLEKFQFFTVVCNAIKSPLTNVVVNPLDAVYIGLTRTFAKENLQANIQAFNLSELSIENLISIQKNQFQFSPLSCIHLSDAEYYVEQLSPILLENHVLKAAFKMGGCYLILGGTGGLGRMLAQYLVDSYGAEVICVGRKFPKVDDVLFSNPKVFFESIDLLNQDEVTELFEKYPKINGIIHSALVLEDASILSMTPNQLTDVLGVKLQGTFNLINQVANRHFDFILFFSSIQSFIANAGQANYTAACLAKDALASMIESIFMVKTVIINWGYWGEIGVVASDYYRRRMDEAGIGSITQDEGIRFIEQCLSEGLEQAVYLKCTDEALEEMKLIDNKNKKNNKILKPFLESSAEVLRNKAAMKALDDYSCCEFNKLEIPVNVIPRYIKLLDALRVIENKVSLNKSDLLGRFPELKGYTDLLDTCLQNFSAVMSGGKDPLSVLFPDGSFNLVEPVYRNSPVPDYYNKVVADAVVQFLQNNRFLNRTINILEIGSGTGSTSEKVIPCLGDYNVRYVFSDLSYAFLNNARRQFSAYNFIDYKIIDIEMPDLELGTFDIVIATNVIHATRDIEKTLLNIKNLLSNGGVLLLNEITERQVFATLTFGLTDGWWLSQDENRIPYSPLLNIQTWQKLLYQVGFSDFDSHGGNGQHVISAYSNQASGNDSQSREQGSGLRSREQGNAKGEVIDWLKNIISQVMHIPIGELINDQPFRDYGIDSLISLELLTPIKSRLGYVPATLLFEYPTIEQVAQYLLDEHRSSFFTSSDGAESNQPPGRVETAQGVEFDKLGLISQKVKSSIASVLHMDANEIRMEIPFKDYGVDSLISLEIVSSLRKEFGYLPATILFEYPTLDSLAKYLLEQGHEIDPSPLQGSVQNLTASESMEVPSQKLQILDESDIAIVGIAGRYPGADDEEALWQLLASGKDAFSQVPWQRWNSSEARGSYTQVGAFIENIEYFDNDFFRIPPVEAERIDPQERLFLETTYHALEDASLRVSSLSGKNVGCYVGAMNHGYSWLTVNDASEASPTSLFWSIANRASYHFNWHGPSFAVDSACSSSLTAIHTAVSAIQQKDCEIAVVGGVNLIVHPRQFDLLCGLHMLSKTNICKPFGDGADGFVDGEGIISIVLMPYSKAKRDNHRIYGVIRSTAVNAGGKANGYTAPNAKAQSELVKRALDKARLQPSDINYIEAHGTGTELGDPIEISGLRSAFCDLECGSLPIGSVKGNLGHLESAAGLASVVKVLLQMRCGKLVPSIHAEVENPHLRLKESPFFINKKLAEWKTSEPYRACISSFGAGGANAHVIIESDSEFLAINKSSSDQRIYFFPLSAHTEKALQNELLQLKRLAEKLSESQLMSLSYGYCCIREPLKYRAGFFANNLAEVKQAASRSLQWYRRKRPSDSMLDSSVLMCEFARSDQLDASIASRVIEIYNAGGSVDYSCLFSRRYESLLPRFPFNSLPYWVNAKESNMHDQDDIVKQHKMFGNCMAPAAFIFSFLERELSARSIENIVWKSIITDIDTVDLQADGRYFKIYDQNTDLIFCEGEYSTEANENASSKLLGNDFKDDGLNFRLLDGEEIYAKFKFLGYEYGKKYQAIRQACVTKNRVDSILCVDQDWGFALSPALIDASLQTAILLKEGELLLDNELQVPFMVENFSVYRLPKLTEPLYCCCTLKTSADSSKSIYDIDLTDVNGELCVSLRGVVSIKTTIENLLNVAKNESAAAGAVQEFELN